MRLRRCRVKPNNKQLLPSNPLNSHSSSSARLSLNLLAQMQSKWKSSEKKQRLSRRETQVTLPLRRLTWLRCRGLRVNLLRHRPKKLQEVMRKLSRKLRLSLLRNLASSTIASSKCLVFYRLVAQSILMPSIMRRLF